MSPANLGEAEPSEDIIFPYSDIFRCLRVKHLTKDQQWRKIRHLKDKGEISPKSWYTWTGYDLDDAEKILYYVTERETIRNFDPYGALGKMWMAHYDLNDSIPSAAAARILGLETPEFKVGGKYHNGEPLPFKNHPRRKIYPWIRKSVAKRSEIKELLESGEYPGYISYNGEVDRHGQGDQHLRSA